MRGEGLATGSRVRVDGLKAKPELNGSYATVVGLNEDTGRYNVMIDDRREALALKLEALSLAEEFGRITLGAKVRLAGLDKKPDGTSYDKALNGLLATVISFSGETCTVEVDDMLDEKHVRQRLALKPESLALAEEAPSSKPAKADDGSRQVVVTCGKVSLKLTLTEKQMRKTVADAVIKPFLKAYSKKVGSEVGIAEVRQVTIDSDGQRELQVLTDIHIFTTEQALRKLEGDIDIEILLKGDGTAAGEAPKAPPKKAPSAVPDEILPKHARVMILGLTSDAGSRLNGKIGKVQFWHPDTKRYDVVLEGQEETGNMVSAKRENLTDVGPKGDMAPMCGF